MKWHYLQRDNQNYIETLFEAYQKDPKAIDASWRYFFDGLSLSNHTATAEKQTHASASLKVLPTPKEALDLSAEAKVGSLISAYRSLGYVLANLDPLKPPLASHPLLELSHFGLQEEDMDRTFNAGRLLGMGRAHLKEIIHRLRSIYCSHIGVEFTHIQSPEIRTWLQEKMETSQNQESLSAEEKQFILKRLIQSSTFESFLHKTYVAQKRFSIEGAEALIPFLDRLIEEGARFGAEQIVMGMAHRGRLNVLRNIYQKKAEYIFTEFEQQYQLDETIGEGDVKYHMGFSADITTRHGHHVHLSLAHNPSHLEAVNPVAEGITRGKQRYLNDDTKDRVFPILIHGDAAFSGQGSVYETLNLSQLHGYFTGGTIHAIINNRIGFTTDPKDARSTHFPTDIAKMLEVPIFHVNADAPESVWYLAKLCMEFRQKFKKDVFLDLICYRKYGHNEGDEPSFTQPLLYKKIKKHPSVSELYAKQLVQEKILSEKQFDQETQEVFGTLREARRRTQKEKPKPFMSAFQSIWKTFHHASEKELYEPIPTTISKTKLLQLGNQLTELPTDFHLHPKLKKFFAKRREALQIGTPFDWGHAEALAYASLLTEGHPIRLSGQDVGRGTFSHRHAILSDYETGHPYIPLNHLQDGQEALSIQNSHLSELAVLGFEYGWSTADPNALVIWEGQFGDFVNSAQVIIDQFIAPAESKWQRSSGLVLYLPHGYAGQGPEHSSSRIERFLQLCGKQNLTVCNATKPAQLFHLLRRQMKRSFRKPLILFTPKSLLRHPEAISSLEDFTQGTFHEVLDDPLVEDKKSIKHIILCSGKIFYELSKARKEAQRADLAIIRLEQLYPWPEHHLISLMQTYPQANSFHWVQEEPKNMGAWTFVFTTWENGEGKNFLKKVKNHHIHYIGRPRAAAAAVGSFQAHLKEQKTLIEQAMNIHTSS